MLVKCILLLMPCHFHFQSACWCFSIELLMELVCFRNFSCPPSVPKEACTCEISVSHDAVFVAGNPPPPPPPPHLWHSPSLNYNPCKIRFLSSSYISLQISATLSISLSLSVSLTPSLSWPHSISLSLTHSPSLFPSFSLHLSSSWWPCVVDGKSDS